MPRDQLSTIRASVARIERPAAAHGVLSLGIAAIDRALPGGGIARGALHEIRGTAGDEEDGVLAAAFAVGIIARLGGGAVLWGLPRADLYGPGLAACGLDPRRLVLVRATHDAEILWAMEEGLRAPGVAAVVGEVGMLTPVASRRLQFAAERSGITAFLLRRWRTAGEAARERDLPNAAATRWRISVLPAIAVGGAPWVGQPRWRVELYRCRGGMPGSWTVTVGEGKLRDAADPLSVAETLAGRSMAPCAAARFGQCRRAG